MLIKLSHCLQGLRAENPKISYNPKVQLTANDKFDKSLGSFSTTMFKFAYPYSKSLEEKL